MRQRPRPSVIIVREWEQQLTGSGCCGKLEGDFLGCGEDAVFRERRSLMERMGPVYRAVRDRFGDEVDLQVIDPRNVGLLIMLLRDFRLFRLGLRTALATLFRLPKQGIVVNGMLVDRSDRPDPERIAALVGEAVRGGARAS